MVSDVNEQDEIREHGDDTRERDDHLDDVDDGCGCVEVWEELSEQRVGANGG